LKPSLKYNNSTPKNTEVSITELISKQEKID